MEEFNIVQAWIDSVGYAHTQNKGTADRYIGYLNHFCEFIGQTPEEIVETYEKSTDREFRRKYAQYLKAYISKLTQKGYAPNTIHVAVTSVRSFFKYSDLPLAFIPSGRNRVLWHNRDITKDEIVQILKVSAPRDKAFFTMMSQSGLRPVTMCRLRIKHLQPDLEKGIIPCKIEVPQDLAKGQYRPYFSFIGEESITHLKEYLSTRSNTSPDDLLFTSYGENKPLNPKSISRIFREKIEKLKDKGIIKFQERQFRKPAELRLYCLRKYFRKHAHEAGLLHQFWMGHVVREGVDEHYRPHDVEWHREQYRTKAMPHLRLESPTASETDVAISTLASEVGDLKRKVEKRDKTIEALTRVLKAKPLTNEEIEKYRGSYYFDQVQTLSESYDKLLDMIQKQQEEIKRLKQKKPT